jgi:crossover junction endodeoxyribonuclease RuvC
LRVVGVDPGSLITGWGAVESTLNEKNGFRDRSHPSEIRYLCSGRIVASRRKSIQDRLRQVYRELREILEEWSPAAVGVEKAFMAGNPLSALRLGETRGVILLAAAESGVDLYEYTPAEIKTAVTGHGRATKVDVQRMIQRLLPCPGPLPEDEADALGVALSCLYRTRFASAVAAFENRRGTPAAHRS